MTSLVPAMIPHRDRTPQTADRWGRKRGRGGGPGEEVGGGGGGGKGRERGSGRERKVTLGDGKKRESLEAEGRERGSGVSD